MGQWLLLHLADIVSHPNQLRKAFDPKATREVSDCIKAVGVNMSITVHPHEEEKVSHHECQLRNGDLPRG